MAGLPTGRQALSLPFSRIKENYLKTSNGVNPVRKFNKSQKFYSRFQLDNSRTMYKKSHANFLTGFTLLETIVALGIILGGITGAFGLAIKGLSIASVSKNKLIAANLAQEGVELVRRIRDNNTIADISDGVYDASPVWTTGIGADGDCTRQYMIDVLNDTLVFYDGSKLLFSTATGLYTRTEGTVTAFQRVIEITRSPCPSFQTMAGVDAGDQLKVRSTVSWTERGVAKSVALDEILFNWR